MASDIASGGFTPLDDVALAGRHSDLQGFCLQRRGVSRLAHYAFRMDRCSAWRRRYRALDIALYDAAVRARACKRGELDAALAGKPPRQRRGEDALVVTVDAVRPDLLGDLVHDELGRDSVIPLLLG